MKKFISLIIFALAITACDPYEKRVSYFDGDFTVATKEGQDYLLDAKDNVLWQADKIEPDRCANVLNVWRGTFGNKVVLYYAGDSYGEGKFASDKYDDIINPTILTFYPAYEMRFEKFIVKQGNLWGVVDYSGKSIIPAKYSSIYLVTSYSGVSPKYPYYNFLCVTPDGCYYIYNCYGTESSRIGKDWYNSAISSILAPGGEKLPVRIVSKKYIMYK